VQGAAKAFKAEPAKLRRSRQVRQFAAVFKSLHEIYKGNVRG
jgi:hypothetical protein